MSHKKNIFAGVVSALLVAPAANADSPSTMNSMMGANFPTHVVTKDKLERCFGVSKRGRNDCGTTIHACANQAQSNNDPSEWIYVLKGNCAKITGGALASVDHNPYINRGTRKVSRTQAKPRNSADEVLY